MSVLTESVTLQSYCLELARQAREASQQLKTTRGDSKDRWLKAAASAIRQRSSEIFEANQLDLEAAPGHGLSSAAIDRLRLDQKRIDSIAAALNQIADLRDPVGEVIAAENRPNGLSISKIRVPLGVIFMMYESRPNVTADAAALSLKSGNAVILRGGKEAKETNLSIFRILVDQLETAGLPRYALQYVDKTDREAVGHLLQLSEFIDLAIPRGGPGLIQRVASEAKMPVLKHDAGLCHVYIDAAADPKMAIEIAVNSKAQRPGVCNAAETLLIHQAIAPKLLPQLAQVFEEEGVELRGDHQCRTICPGLRSATVEDWGTEYLDRILAIRVVESISEAIAHIGEYGSGHTDAIVTNDLKAARQFTTEVDSAAVLVNASTRFNDGGELGLGAEIGISTDRFHARGPCGLRELTTTKWIVIGDGQVRT